MSSMILDAPSAGRLWSWSPKRPPFSANLRNSFMPRTPLLEDGVSLIDVYFIDENTTISFLARETATFSLRPPPARLIGPNDWATTPSLEGPYPMEKRMRSLSSPWTVSRFFMNMSSGMALSLAKNFESFETRSSRASSMQFCWLMLNAITPMLVPSYAGSITRR